MDDTDRTLKYAWFDGVAWHSAVVDGTYVGEYTSLAVLGSGEPAISYRDSLGRLKYAYRTSHDLGDLNCDGCMDAADIDPFFLALSRPSDYVQSFPDCDISNGDINVDDWIDGADSAYDSAQRLLGQKVVESWLWDDITSRQNFESFFALRTDAPAACPARERESVRHASRQRG